MTDVPRDVAPVLPAASAPSPADRDRAIARLSVLSDLDRLVADLPATAPSTRVVMPVDRHTSTQRVRSVFSNVERRGYHYIRGHGVSGVL